MVAVALGVAIGCGKHPTDEQIQQQAAQATQKAKEDAQDAAAKARVAAAEAERRLNAVAAGVKQGLNSNGAPPVDINSATTGQLEALPGVTPIRAQRIVQGRPYSDPHDLVARHVLTEHEYRRISAQIVTK